MTYRLEKGKEIPKAYNALGEFMPVLRLMAVGDSFVVPEKSKHTKAKAAASNYKNREGKGKDFVSRVMSDGLRIWRIK